MYYPAIIIPMHTKKTANHYFPDVQLIGEDLWGNSGEFSQFFLGSFSYVLRKLSSGADTHCNQQHTEVVFFFQFPA